MTSRTGLTAPAASGSFRTIRMTCLALLRSGYISEWLSSSESIRLCCSSSARDLDKERVKVDRLVVVHPDDIPAVLRYDPARPQERARLVRHFRCIRAFHKIPSGMTKSRLILHPSRRENQYILCKFSARKTDDPQAARYMLLSHNYLFRDNRPTRRRTAPSENVKSAGFPVDRHRFHVVKDNGSSSRSSFISPLMTVSLVSSPIVRFPQAFPVNQTVLEALVSGQRGQSRASRA